jgi:hypothetical protein
VISMMMMMTMMRTTTMMTITSQQWWQRQERWWRPRFLTQQLTLVWCTSFRWCSRASAQSACGKG